MRHIDDPNATRAEAPECRKQPLDIGVGKRRGRLVENEDVRLHRERPADRDERTLGRRQGRHAGVRVEVASHDGERVGGGLADGAPGDQPEARARISGEERDVLRHRHPLDQSKILMDESDRQFFRPRIHDAVGKPRLASIRRIDTRQDLDKRGFARAVLPE